MKRIEIATLFALIALTTPVDAQALRRPVLPWRKAAETQPAPAQTKKDVQQQQSADAGRPGGKIIGFIKRILHR